MPGCYLDKEFVSKIKKEDIKVIFEIGSRDCMDAIRLNKFYNAKVYSFECNPIAIEICKENLKKHNITSDQVELIENAVFNERKQISFFPVTETENADKFFQKEFDWRYYVKNNKDIKNKFKTKKGALSHFELYGKEEKRAHRYISKNGHVDFFKTQEDKYANIGASSIFKLDENFQKKKYNNSNYHKQNKEIFVDAITLDDFIEERGIKKVDLICMDLQGCELMAFQGMKNNLKNTKYIITELQIVDMYKGQGSLKEVIKLLKNSNFKKYLGDIGKKFQDDFLFKNLTI